MPVSKPPQNGAKAHWCVKSAGFAGLLLGNQTIAPIRIYLLFANSAMRWEIPYKSLLVRQLSLIGSYWHNLVYILPQWYYPVARLLASKGGEVAGSESGAGMLEAYPCIQFAFLHHLPIRLQPWMPLLARQEDWTLLSGKQGTVGNTLIFWWNDESIYKHKEWQRLTFSSNAQQKDWADEKRKATQRRSSLFFWRAVWWNADERLLH